jgi:LPXTG-motif cell wall-anchored protein
LVVSGSKLPRMPIFNSVSTGSVASDRRATIVRPRQTPPKRPTSTLTVAWGRLPQTGEVAVGSTVFLGVILLVAVTVHYFIKKLS